MIETSLLEKNKMPLGTLFFPNEISTSRLQLKRYSKDDMPQFAALVSRNMDQLVDGFPKTTRSIGRKEGEALYFQEKNDEWNQSKAFYFGIWLRDHNKQIGQLQIKSVAWDIPSAEFGYFIDSVYQNNGYATEALKSVIQICFDDFQFRRLYVRIMPENTPSIRLIEKVGFFYEGTHRNEFKTGRQKISDVKYYSKVL